MRGRTVLGSPREDTCRKPSTTAKKVRSAQQPLDADHIPDAEDLFDAKVAREQEAKADDASLERTQDELRNFIVRVEENDAETENWGIAISTAIWPQQRMRRKTWQLPSCVCNFKLAGFAAARKEVCRVLVNALICSLATYNSDLQPALDSATRTLSFSMQAIIDIDSSSNNIDFSLSLSKVGCEEFSQDYFRHLLGLLEECLP